MNDSPITREEIDSIKEAIVYLARQAEGIGSDSEGCGPDIESGVRAMMGMKTKTEESEQFWAETQKRWAEEEKKSKDRGK